MLMGENYLHIGSSRIEDIFLVNYNKGMYIKQQKTIDGPDGDGLSNPNVEHNFRLLFFMDCDISVFS